MNGRAYLVGTFSIELGLVIISRGMDLVQLSKAFVFLYDKICPLKGRT